MHKLLQRQIRKHLDADLCADPAISAFLAAVDAAYRQADEDRALLERSLDLTSRELLERNEQLERDLTEIRRLEVELRQADKLRAIGQLAAGVAHELNTPIQYVADSIRFVREGYDALVSLRGAWDRLCQTIESAEPAGSAQSALRTLNAQAEEADLDYVIGRALEAFVRAQQGLSRMSQTVNALKEFALPAETNEVLSDLNHSVLSAVAVTRHEIGAVAELELTLAPLPPIACHPSDMNQVFLHLLRNAAQAIAARYQGSEQRGLIRITSAVEPGHVVVSIADDGAGIRPEHTSRIFEPFFTTKSVGTGSGQGLAHARALVVDKHHGSLTFESDVATGTVFVVRLPLP